MFKIILLLSNLFVFNIHANDFFEKKLLTVEKELRQKIGLKTSLTNYNVIYPVNVGVVDSGLSSYVTDYYHFNPEKIRHVSSFDSFNIHGVHVQGIIFLLSKNKFINHYNYYTTLNPIEQTQNFAIELSNAVSENRIINISGGGQSPYIEEFHEMEKGKKRGVIFVSASGNDGKNLKNWNYFPSSYAKHKYFNNVISVANFIDKNTLTESSNYSGEVFIGAHGNSVPSLCADENESVCYLTGTSQATPIITSAITLLLERYPYLTMEQIKFVLSINSIKNKNTLKYTKVGLFDFESFVKWLNKEYSIQDIFPNRLDLQKKYAQNPNVNNIK